MEPVVRETKVFVRDVSRDSWRGLAVLLMVLDHFLVVAGADDHWLRMTVTRLCLPLFVWASVDLEWSKRTWWRISLWSVVTGIMFALAKMPFVCPLLNFTVAKACWTFIRRIPFVAWFLVVMGWTVGTWPGCYPPHWYWIGWSLLPSPGTFWPSLQKFFGFFGRRALLFYVIHATIILLWSYR